MWPWGPVLAEQGFFSFFCKGLVSEYLSMHFSGSHGHFLTPQLCLRHVQTATHMGKQVWPRAPGVLVTEMGGGLAFAEPAGEQNVMSVGVQVHNFMSRYIRWLRG